MTSSGDQATTGVSGLDDVLQGGLSRGHVFLLEGEPGAGKTTIAFQFLLEGAKAGENSLYFTLSETEAELRNGAASHGWTLGPEISVFELIPPESLLDSEQQQSLLYSSDLELGETTRKYSTRSSVLSLHGWSWTVSPKFVFWPKAPCAIAVRSLPSSIILRAMARRSSCLTISPRKPRTRLSTA